jgi:hypothetical protein
VVAEKATLVDSQASLEECIALHTQSGRCVLRLLISDGMQVATKPATSTASKPQPIPPSTAPVVPAHSTPPAHVPSPSSAAHSPVVSRPISIGARGTSPAQPSPLTSPLSVSTSPMTSSLGHLSLQTDDSFTFLTASPTTATVATSSPAPSSATSTLPSTTLTSAARTDAPAADDVVFTSSVCELLTLQHDEVQRDRKMMIGLLHSFAQSAKVMDSYASAMESSAPRVERLHRRLLRQLEEVGDVPRCRDRSDSGELANKLADALTELEACAAARNHLQTQLDAATTGLDELQARSQTEHGQLTTQLQRQSAKCEQLHARLSATQEQIERGSDDTTALTTQNNELHASLAALTQQLEEQREQLRLKSAAADQELHNANEQFVAREHELAECRAALQQRDASLATAQREVAEERELVHEHEEAKRQLTEKLAEEESSLAEQLTALHTLQQEKAELRTTLDEHLRTGAEASIELTSTQEKLAAALTDTDQLDDLRTEVEQLRSQVDEQAVLLTSSKEVERELGEQLNAHQQRVATLERGEYRMR